ncbi:MAG: carboxypeptidase-like regulatory domain-containing protein, partial [Tannerellaceae bacterium]|nr:carboxypeptidase-like regulatory domain-containing protein [Tannerellaceae bacterium]
MTFNVQSLRVLLVIFFFSFHLSAQERRPEGLIRGSVIDAASGQILPGATVVILDSNPVNGTAADSRGHFLLEHLPIGRYALQASLVGYEPAVFKEIIV